MKDKPRLYVSSRGREMQYEPDWQGVYCLDILEEKPGGEGEYPVKNLICAVYFFPDGEIKLVKVEAP